MRNRHSTTQLRKWEIWVGVRFRAAIAWLTWSDPRIQVAVSIVSSYSALTASREHILSNDV